MQQGSGALGRLNDVSIKTKLSACFGLLVLGLVVAVVETGARRTDEGAVVVERTREAFLSIGQAVEDMAGRVQQIAAAAQQVSAAAGTMQASIGEVASVAEQSSATSEQVSASTQESSASAEQIAASASELSTNAEGLTRLVSQFKLAAGSDAPDRS